MKINDLSFSFPGRLPLLYDISFECQKGKITTLIGEVGSGKSVLISILQRFYLPISGHIYLDEYLIDEIDIADFREMLGVVEQNVKIFNGLLLDNIVMGKKDTTVQEVVDFCVEFGFDNYFSAFPQGYMTIVGEEGINLSGGQKQLIALARALFKKPKILLLDEPTASMDKTTENFIYNLIGKLKTNMMILIISHKESIFNIADNVYLLENGTITSQLSQQTQ